VQVVDRGLHNRDADGHSRADGFRRCDLGRRRVLEKVIAEESRPGDESSFVSLDQQITSEELDRYVGRTGGVVVAA
jgi:hypothetical protein